MRKELDDYLVKRYPDMFVERNGDPSKTQMVWGFQCGDGWFNLLNNLCLSIEDHINYVERQNEYNKKYLELIEDNKLDAVPDWIHKQYKEGKLNIEPIPNVIVDGVKEKFGELRFSIKGGNKNIRGMIAMAHSMSSKTCEECGKPGQMSNTTSGWVRSLCAEHDPKSSDKKELEIKSKIKALSLGKLITLEIIKINNENEVVGTFVEVNHFANPKDKNKPIEYFTAKKVETDVHTYWDAVPLEN